MTVCFVELEAFTEEMLRVADEETLRQFEAELAARPEAGDLIRHSGGLRKARMKLPGRGKSSGDAELLALLAAPTIAMLAPQLDAVEAEPETEATAERRDNRRDLTEQRLRRRQARPTLE